MSPSATVRRCRTPRSFKRTFPGSRLCNKRHSTGYEGAARCKHRFTRKDTFLKSQVHASEVNTDSRKCLQSGFTLFLRPLENTYCNEQDTIKWEVANHPSYLYGNCLLVTIPDIDESNTPKSVRKSKKKGKSCEIVAFHKIEFKKMKERTKRENIINHSQI